MNKNNIILNPILSEKSHSLIEQFNQYIFKVSSSSNKLEIKDAIEKRFKVKIKQVRVMNLKGKMKSFSIKSDGHIIRTTGKQSSWKKAIVTLSEGHKINLVEGEF